MYRWVICGIGFSHNTQGFFGSAQAYLLRVNSQTRQQMKKMRHSLLRDMLFGLIVLNAPASSRGELFS